MKSTRYMSYREWEKLSTEERNQTQKASPEEQAWLDRLKALLEEIPEGLELETGDDFPEGDDDDRDTVPMLKVWKTYCRGALTELFSHELPEPY